MAISQKAAAEDWTTCGPGGSCKGATESFSIIPNSWILCVYCRRWYHKACVEIEDTPIYYICPNTNNFFIN